MNISDIDNIVTDDDIAQRIRELHEPHKDGEVLRHLFNDVGLRQKQVANLLGVSEVAVWHRSKEAGGCSKKTGRPSHKELRETEAMADPDQTGLGRWS